MTKNNLTMPLEERVAKVFFYIIVAAFALICLFPFTLMVTSSFMNEKEILTEGFKLLPDEWSFSAYEFLFRTPKKLIDAYGVTILTAVIGTLMGLLCMSMAGYVLCRKDFRYRNQISFFIYFTTLFSGGLIPSYLLMVNGLHQWDSIWAMILPAIMAIIRDM